MPALLPPRRRLVWFGLALALSPWRPNPSAAADPDWNALHRQHDGGTLQITADASFGTIDPQVNYLSKGAQIFYVLYDQLVTIRRVNNDPGTQLVPDLADAMPQVADQGRTYIFHLRQNTAFSNGHVLNTQDVVASMVRLFKVQNPNAGSWYNIIIGGDDCVVHPETCTLKDGVVADEAAHTVTFHLVHPDSEFLYKMSFPFASILPADTPTHDLGTTAAPTTGAYQVDSYDPTRLLVLSRNPHFHEFSREAQPRGFVDRMEYHFGLENEAEVTAVLNDQYDYMYETKPLDRLTELGAQHADRVHIGELPEYYYMPLNLHMDPFDNKDARLAVAYAVDRRAIVKLFGGSRMGTPLCQQVPRGIPGYQPYCPFTLNPDGAWSAPDMARARALMRASGKSGHTVTLIVQDTANSKDMGEYLRSLLQDLGFDAKLKTISSQIEFNYIQNTNNKVQASLTDWTADYPTASDYLQVLFSCGNFHPGSDNSVNMSGTCDPAVDRRMDAALVTALTDPAAANRQWARIDRDITDTAASITLFQANELSLVSSRLGNYTWSYLMHMMFAMVWVR
jgi:peptide/nickel transport system substrate-binding protein